MIGRHVVAIAVLASCGGGVITPPTPYADCWDCKMREPSTGQSPAAIATYTKLQMWTSWSGTCEPEVEWIPIGAFDIHDPTSEKQPVSCHDVDYHVTLACRTGVCEIDRTAVTPKTAGDLVVHATFTSRGGERRELDLAPIKIRRPDAMVARCERAEPGFGTVVVELYGSNLLVSGADATLSLDTGTRCDPVPIEENGVFTWRRYKCPLGDEAKLHVQAKGADFAVSTWITCPPVTG